MTIGIDGNEANVKTRVGVSVYTFNLLHYFKKRSNGSTQFVIFLKEKPFSDLPEENSYFRYEVVEGKFLWSQISLPIRLYSKRDIDVFFSPAHYAPRFCPVPLVVTVHDLSYFYYPQDFLKGDLYKLKKWTQYSVTKAKKIIAVSKTTKKDIIRFHNVPEEKIEVIYNGYEKIAGGKNQAKIKGTQNPYILYVGTLQPRKNLPALIEAFSEFKKLYPEFHLILAGKKGWLYQNIFNTVEELGLTNDVFFTDYVTDNQLAFLYKNAYCFVLPSFYEGFGIPILESMSFDCPVLCSFSSSLPEIGGDACLYFDPTQSHDILEKLLLIKKDLPSKNDLIKKGKQRVKLFSWQDCASKTLDILKQYGSKNS